ncbi:MAG: hypothetical protein ACOY46_03105 [Bacillota bacterium]
MNLITRLEKLIDIYENSEIGANPIDQLLDSLYEEKKTSEGKHICNLLQEGYCHHVIGEDCPGYDDLDECPVKMAGLWWCGEQGQLVNKEQCKDCNQEQECGCCEHVHSGSAPYNCSVCAKIQIPIGEIGHYCVSPDTIPEEIERIKKEAEEDPGRFFSCY